MPLNCRPASVAFNSITEGVAMTRAITRANGNTRRGQALLLVPYFGSFGPWFPLFLHSVAMQHTLDVLLLSDSEPPALPANVRRVEMTLDELRKLANAKLATPVRLHRLRNVCDLKPAYGLIFEEFTHGYEYWAFGDEDVLYGDVDGILGPHLDGTTDLVIPGIDGKSGHLTVLRNHSRVNELATKDPTYKEVLASREHWAYDETSWRLGADISSFHKVVTQGEARGELVVRRGLPRTGGVPRRGRSFVYDGQRIRENNGWEILYYHWGKLRRQRVQWPTADQAQNGFAFDRYGFYAPELGGAQQVVRRGVGRVRELASDGRRRLRNYRAAMRATIGRLRSAHAWTF
jgi:uncharacterized protein DUF6625